MPDPSFSILYVVPGFPSILFSYFFTTSSLPPLLFHRMHLVVCHILLVIPFPSGEVSAHSCGSRRLSLVVVTREFGENGRNFLCNMCATQPIGTLLSPPSCQST